jgi:hypothetical protein
MANPAAPTESGGAKMGFGIFLDGADDAVAWPRIEDAAVVADETTKSGSLRVIPMGGTGKAGIIDDGAFTPGTSGVVMGGFQADESATDSVDEGDAGAARMTLDRKQIVTEYAHATGGYTPYAALSTAAVLTAEIKGSAGKIASLQCFNNGANEVFIRLYNQTGAPGSGDAANIVWRGMIPGNAAGAGFSIPIPIGIACATGIGVRVSGAVADNDTTVLAANEVMVNVQYK